MICLVKCGFNGGGPSCGPNLCAEVTVDQTRDLEKKEKKIK